MKFLGFLLLTSLFNFGLSYTPNSFNDLDHTKSSRRLLQTTNSSTGNSSSATPRMLQLITDQDFDFEILRDRPGADCYSGADVGEVLTAAAQIVPGDFESYSTIFNNLANRANAKARNIDACRFPVSAREALFRASTYFRSADFFLHGNWSDPRIYALYGQWIAAFNGALSLLPVPVSQHYTQHVPVFVLETERRVEKRHLNHERTMADRHRRFAGEKTTNIDVTEPGRVLVDYCKTPRHPV